MATISISARSSKAKNASATSAANYEFDPIVTSGPGAEPANSPRWYTGEQASPSLLAQLKFFDYPWAFVPIAVSYQRNYQTAFGTPPDLKGRYALGLDWAGQPVYEVANDVNPNTASHSLISCRSTFGQVAIRNGFEQRATA